MNPRIFKKDLSEYGYSMEVDVKKDDCNREAAHWHLCKNGRRIGQIMVPRCVWTELPSDCSRRVIAEAEELTREYADEIESVYNYNRLNGAG